MILVSNFSSQSQLLSLIRPQRPIQPRFHYASGICLRLAITNNSLDRSTKSTPSPRQRRGSDSLYAHNFRFYFTPLSGVLFTFPSRYLFTIDRKIYLALEGGPPRFSQGFTCPDLLDTINYKVRDTWHTGLSPSLAVLSRTFCLPRPVRDTRPLTSQATLEINL